MNARWAIQWAWLGAIAAGTCAQQKSGAPSARPHDQRADDRAPRVGQAAPEIDLPRLGSVGRYRLSEQLRQRPTVLVFGSYT